jgi:hypothetical protein
MKWVGVTQWGRALGRKSHLTNASPAGQERPPRASPAMGVRSGRARGGRPREGAPQDGESWPAGEPQRERGTSRRCARAGRPPSWVREGQGAGHHRGLRAGQVFPGVARARGSTTGLRAQRPEWGPGGPQALAWSGGCPQATSPMRTPRTPCSRRGIGQRAPSAATREGPGGVCAAPRPGAGGGTAPHGPHGRAGHAGPPVGLEGPRGAPPGSPTVSRPLQGMAPQAQRSPERVCNHGWHVSDQAFLLAA